MSTKTTFKRIALVAVAALGFGVLSSVSPANAVATSFALDKTSITVVDDRSGGSDTLVAVFAITVTNTDTGTGAGLTQNDTITASVVGGPATLANGNAYTLSAWQTDVKFIEVKQSAATRVDPVYSGAIIDTQTGGTSTAYDAKIGAANTGHYGMGAATTSAASTTASDGKTRTYYIAATATRATVVNLGVYTLQFDLTNGAGATIQRSTAKFDVVSAAASSGAVLAAASTGQWFVGDTPSAANQVVTDKQITATLTNRDGGAVRTGTGAAPTLSAQVADASTVINYQTLTIEDTAAESITAGAATNGVYGINSSSAWTGQKGPLTLTVRYGLASATASIALALAATASTTGTGSVTATGAIKGSGTATLPLTTKSVKFSYAVALSSVAQTGYSTYYTLTNGASCSAGDMSIADTTAPVKVLTDETGVASITVTNAFPLTGCTVAVTWIGAATNTTATQTVTWSKSAADAALPTPGGSYQSLTKAAIKTTWTIVDQFGAVMPGASVTFSHTGANAPTVTPAAALSDANGQVSYSFTDALGVAASTTLGTDTVGVATVNAVAPTTSLGKITVTYKTALDVVASLYSTYTVKGGVATLVPATTIAGAAGTGIVASALDQIDWSKAVTVATAAAETGVVKLDFTAKTAADVAVTGIPTTVTATGGYILGADGKLATTRTIYANDSIYVIGAKTGVVSVTATNGTLTKTASILFVNASTDARYIAVTESAGKIVATVTDWQGNAVSGVDVDVTTSGTGSLGNGASFAKFTTSTGGVVSFNVVGDATVTVKVTTAGKTVWLADYADATGTVSTPGVKAGVRSASVATNGIADVASAAADAAAEATDAANAATDAANAAAEAADAATAAAQDAADAVAALSTQVSEMVNALKKQITALTNLVIKIQKKVKA